jgi:hypothetical protein
MLRLCESAFCLVINMANWISNEKAKDEFQLSNGATYVLVSVLILAGSDTATTPWEQELVTWISEHDQSVFGTGVVGFDIDRIAWRKDDFIAQKAFVLRMVDLALARRRWDVLSYDPPYAQDHLAKFRQLIDAYVITMIDEETDWEWRQTPEFLTKCPKHQVFVHANGCQICHDSGG